MKLVPENIKNSHAFWYKKKNFVKIFLSLKTFTCLLFSFYLMKVWWFRKIPVTEIEENIIQDTIWGWQLHQRSDIFTSDVPTDLDWMHWDWEKEHELCYIAHYKWAKWSFHFIISVIWKPDTEEECLMYNEQFQSYL